MAVYVAAGQPGFSQLNSNYAGAGMIYDGDCCLPEGTYRRSNGVKFYTNGQCNYCTYNRFPGSSDFRQLSSNHIGNRMHSVGFCLEGTERCAPNCRTEWLGDGECDSACNNPNCGYDFLDCPVDEPQCSPGCYQTWINDGECDPNCQTSGCLYDGEDCRQTSQPTVPPTPQPTVPQTPQPTVPQTPQPTVPQTPRPTRPQPTTRPTKHPTPGPSLPPTPRPTGLPSASPLPQPSSSPTTQIPSTSPVMFPTNSPTTSPTFSAAPQGSHFERWKQVWNALDALLGPEEKPPCKLISWNPCACIELFKTAKYTEISLKCTEDTGAPTQHVTSVQFVDVGFAGDFPQDDVDNFLSDSFVEEVSFRGDARLVPSGGKCVKVPHCVTKKCNFDSRLICTTEESLIVPAIVVGSIGVLWILTKIIKHFTNRRFDLLIPAILGAIDIATDLLFGVELLADKKSFDFGVAVMVLVSVGITVNIFVVLLIVWRMKRNPKFHIWSTNRATIAELLIFLSAFSPESFRIASSNMGSAFKAPMSSHDHALLTSLGVFGHLIEDVPMIYIVSEVNRGFVWSTFSILTVTTSAFSLLAGLVKRTLAIMHLCSKDMNLQEATVVDESGTETPATGAEFDAAKSTDKMDCNPAEVPKDDTVDINTVQVA